MDLSHGVAKKRYRYAFKRLLCELWPGYLRRARWRPIEGAARIRRDDRQFRGRKRTGARPGNEHGLRSGEASSATAKVRKAKAGTNRVVEKTGRDTCRAAIGIDHCADQSPGRVPLE